LALFKTVLRSEVAKRVTSTRLVVAREFQVRDAKVAPLDVAAGDPVPLPLVGLNVAFTNAGIGKLRPNEADLGDPSFVAGAAASAKALGDPIDGSGKPLWIDPYDGTAIDGVFLITAGTQPEAAAAANDLITALQDSVNLLRSEMGAVRTGAQRGHEHFGFLDGVSQPAIAGLGTPFEGQRTIDAGHFVFGYGVTSAPRFEWMRNGSFMVIRRLKQLVPEFNSLLASEGARLGMDAELLGARMMGRWQSGAQTVDAPLQDDAELGADPFKNNDFDFSDDLFQRGCPYGAHIRKVNPRADLADQVDGVDPHRIIRQGIPFGIDVTDAEAASGKTSEDRGLLFVCYQSSITNQFEFLQETWANSTGFVFGKVRPGQNGAAVSVGFDPIIGQSGEGGARFTDEALPNFPTGDQRSQFAQPSQTVVPQGGVYLFVPSISALICELAD